MGDDPTRDLVLDAIDGATATIELVETRVSGALFRLTPPLPPFVLAQWRAVVDEVLEFLADLRADVVAMGDTWTIRGAAQQWAAVAGLLRTAGAEIQADQLVADDGFAGEAAVSYRGAAPGQREAFALVVDDVAGRVALELHELAELTADYLSACAMLTFELALAFLTLGRSLVGLPWAQVVGQLGSFAVGARSSIETWLESLLAFSDHSGDIAMRWLALRNATDVPELPGGSWPAAVVPGFARTSGP